MADAVQGAVRNGILNSQASLALNTFGEQIVTGGLPPYTEITRLGQSWSVMNTSALAALVVRPSTVANLTLFNNEPLGGKSYVMDRAFAFNLVSTAAAAKFGLWLCVHAPGLVSPTADITAIKSNVGRNGYGGKAKVDTAMTVIDDGWFPWGTWGDVEPTGVLPGGIVSVDIQGRLIVPPQCGISSQVVSAVTGNTFTTGFAWFEVQLNVE